MSDITTFPLTWPAGWKRSKTRTRAQFSREKRSPYMIGNQQHVRVDKARLTIADGVRRLMDTFRRMQVGDWNVIVSTNVRPRLDGMPSSGSGEPNDPGVAVYWKDYKNRQRCMAIDSYDRVADNLAAIAATLEFMRGIERHGGAEILDRAFLGFQAIPPPGMADWRNILSNPKNLEEAKATYRSLAQVHHPDKGGDPDAFAKISIAMKEAEKELGKT